MAFLEPILASKRDKLVELLIAMGRPAVALSGGVDSAVVAQAAWLAAGDNAIAITAVSPSLAQGEREQAIAIARQIGVRHRLIETTEVDNPDYRRNDASRCYYCKTELYTQIERLAIELQFDVIVNGANLDDRGDYRPGMQAAAEHRVRSPLMEAGLGKSEVRLLAAHWGLPVWDKPATPCLSSRVAYGQEVTPERLSRIDQAEQFLRRELGLAQLRVRLEANDLARIELPVDSIARLIDPAQRQRIVESLRSLGFRYITLDLEGFRSGSMNDSLPLVELQSAR